MKNQTVTAVIGSYTRAEKAKRVLTDSAIIANTVKANGKSGCEFGVEIPEVHKDIAESVLRSAGIRIKTWKS